MQIFFMILLLMKLAKERKFIDIINSIYEKFTANNILKRKTNFFPTKERKKIKVSTFITTIQHCTRSSSQTY